MKRIAVFLLAMSAINNMAIAKSNQPLTATAELVNAEGKKIGKVLLTETKKGVKLMITASDLPPGTHGIHFHETGLCNPPDFKTAGSHFNPHKKEHGLENKKGPHSGDLTNIEVGPDGKVS